MGPKTIKEKPKMSKGDMKLMKYYLMKAETTDKYVDCVELTEQELKAIIRDKETIIGEFGCDSEGINYEDKIRKVLE